MFLFVSRLNQKGLFGRQLVGVSVPDENEGSSLSHHSSSLTNEQSQAKEFIKNYVSSAGQGEGWRKGGRAEDTKGKRKQVNEGKDSSGDGISWRDNVRSARKDGWSWRKEEEFKGRRGSGRSDGGTRFDRKDWEVSERHTHSTASGGSGPGPHHKQQGQRYAPQSKHTEMVPASGEERCGKARSQPEAKPRAGSHPEGSNGVPGNHPESSNGRPKARAGNHPEGSNGRPEARAGKAGAGSHPEGSYGQPEARAGPERGSNGRGAVGQGSHSKGDSAQSSNEKRTRQLKDKNKGSRANHNRKAMADKKRRGGMM